MILKTDWNGFLDELDANWPKDLPIFISRQGVLSTASIHDVKEGNGMCCSSTMPMSELEAKLKVLGRVVKKGRWVSSHDTKEIDQNFWIAGVSYVTEEDQPGLWLDAFPYEPTASDVISSLLNEFIGEGVLDDLDRDQFSHLASPNVIILSPEEIQSFLTKHETLTEVRAKVQAEPMS